MKKFTFCVAFAALSVSAGLARSPFVLSDAVPAECMSMEKVDMPMMNRAISKPASALKFDFVKENRKHLMKKDAQIAALTAPEALPATNVSDVGFVRTGTRFPGRIIIRYKLTGILRLRKMLIIFPCMRIFILQKLLRRSLPIILMAIPTVGTGFFCMER